MVRRPPRPVKDVPDTRELIERVDDRLPGPGHARRWIIQPRNDMNVVAKRGERGKGMASNW